MKNLRSSRGRNRHPFKALNDWNPLSVNMSLLNFLDDCPMTQHNLTIENFASVQRKAYYL